MPLLTSPIDGSPMKQINRFGIELDICPASGGVWLDKGELEKLIAFVKESAEQDAQYFAQNQRATQPRHDEYYRYDKSHKYSDSDYKKGYYKKKSGMSKIMDMFDF